MAQIFKLIGWPRLKISQDMPLSDKATDRADIVLRMENRACVLIEIKRKGKINDSENQVRRYCSLLRPNPKIAVLTDGVRWIIYYVANTGLVPLIDAELSQAGTQIRAALMNLSPAHLNQLYDSKVFDYLAIVEQGLAGLSEEAQNIYTASFAATAKALIQSPEANIPGVPASIYVPPPSKLPTVTTSEVVAVEASNTVATKDNVVHKQQEYNPSTPPPLDFTSIKAIFDNQSVNNWSTLVRVGVAAALRAGNSLTRLRQLLSSQLEESERTTNGFRPVEGYSISVQGMDANKAWKDAYTLARHLGCKIEVKFRYRDDEKVPADRRGKSGVLRWSP